MENGTGEFYGMAEDEEDTPPGGWHDFERKTLMLVNVSDRNSEDWVTHARPCDACGGE